jgi:signal peptidase I
VIVASAFIMFSLKILTGYYSIVSNRTMMRDPFNLIRADKSIYFLFFAVFILSCFAICIQRARYIAQYYNITSNQYSEFAIQDYKTNEIKPPVVAESSSKTARRINRIAVSVLIVIISFSVLINVAVLAVSAMSPGKEVSFMGVVPYVFQSDSMKPAIQKNDLVFFETASDQQTYVVGDIVIFRETNEVFIERIVSVNGSVLTVDIDYYPDLARDDALKKEISEDLVYGKYSGRNRWLGAVILFANSFFGRMILLLIPAILLFFYKPITKFFGVFSKSKKV